MASDEMDLRMDFGDWVKKVREERSLDLRSMEKLTGVDKSTISRIENKNTEATIFTVMPICFGLGFTISEVVKTLSGKNFPFLAQTESPGVLRGGSVLTLQDVKDLLDSDLSKFKQSYVNLLNEVFSLQMGKNNQMFQNVKLFTSEDIDKLLLIDSPLYDFELKYPPELEPKLILEIYNYKGLLTPKDVGLYIKGIRHESKIALQNLEKSGKISDTILSRLETGLVERVKISEVLQIDGILGQEGIILALYGEASQFNEEFILKNVRSFGYSSSSDTKNPRNFKMVNSIVSTIRWLQYLNPKDTNYWIELVKKEFIPISPHLR
ncbi:MAG: helix-turn-helix transcriptional regulator [Chloroflexi bacterium]|nr:helix-turn-helix transcriptional regulator [Chloroflexota bacterium]